MLIAAIVFFVVGTVFTGLGAVMRPNTSQYDQRATGTITQIRYESQGDNPEEFRIGGSGAKGASVAFFVLGGLCDVLGVVFLILFAL